MRFGVRRSCDGVLGAVLVWTAKLMLLVLQRLDEHTEWGK